MRNFKDTKGKAVDVFKNTSKTFNAIGKKFKMKFKVGNLGAEKKLTFWGPTVHHKFSSCDKSEIRWLLIVAAWKLIFKDYEMPSVFLDAQVVQIPRWREMLDAERQKSNTPQAEVLRFRTQNLQISHNWTGLMKRLLSYKLAATAFWRYLGRPQHRLESAATGSGGMSTDVTTFFSKGWSRVRLQQRMTTLLSISTILCSTACPVDHKATQEVHMFLCGR